MNILCSMSCVFRRLATIVACVMLLGGLSGCGVMSASKLSSYIFSEQQLRLLSIMSSKDVNGGYPVALDLVVITDQKVFDALSVLRAAEWFAGKTDYVRQHQKALQVMSWEVVPKQEMMNISMPAFDSSTVGILVFADYLGDRTYRAIVKGQKNATVLLKRDDFEVVPE